MKTNKEKIEKAYLSVRHVIIATCAKFMTEKGGVLEDLVSEAHLHFMNIYLTHDKRTTLERDVAYRLYKKLLETYEVDARRRRMLRPVLATEENVYVDVAPYFDLGEFLAGLSEDAAELVKLALNTPPDVDLEVVQRGEPTPYNIRGAIRQYLRDIHWTAKQIKASFAEIRRALM